MAPLCLAVYKASRAYQPSIEHITKIVDARREHRRLGSPSPEFAGYSEAVEASAQALADMKAEVAELELLGPVDLAKASRQVVDSSSYLDRAVNQYTSIAELDPDRIDPEELNTDDYRGGDWQLHYRAAG